MLNEWFGLGDTASTLIVVAILVVILGVIFIVQTRRMQKSPMGRVLSIQGNIRSNIRACNRFQKKGVIKRLKAEAWEKHHDDIDFLPEELQIDLASLFKVVGEVNQQIDATLDSQATSHTGYVDVSRLLEPQTAINRRIDKWVNTNHNNPKYQPRRRGGLFRF